MCVEGQRISTVYGLVVAEGLKDIDDVAHVFQISIGTIELLYNCHMSNVMAMSTG